MTGSVGCHASCAQRCRGGSWRVYRKCCVGKPREWMSSLFRNPTVEAARRVLEGGEQEGEDLAKAESQLQNRAQYKPVP